MQAGSTRRLQLLHQRLGVPFGNGIPGAVGRCRCSSLAVALPGRTGSGRNAGRRRLRLQRWRRASGTSGRRRLWASGEPELAASHSGGRPAMGQHRSPHPVALIGTVPEPETSRAPLLRLVGLCRHRRGGSVVHQVRPSWRAGSGPQRGTGLLANTSRTAADRLSELVDPDTPAGSCSPPALRLPHCCENGREHARAKSAAGRLQPEPEWGVASHCAGRREAPHHHGEAEPASRDGRQEARSVLEQGSCREHRRTAR